MRKHCYFRKSFSLIELLIVIGILGALAALILPSFTTTEKEAKTTADAYNGAGIVRYVHMFQNANGYFPSGFHTGLDTAGAPLETLPETFAEEGAFDTDSAFSALVLSDAANALYISSLKAAGINYLGAGDVSGATMSPLKDTTATPTVIKIDPTKLDLTFDGRKLADWVKPLQFEMGEHAENGILVALFVTPNVDWETVYSGGYHAHGDHGHFETRTASKIGLKNTPASTVSNAEFKYYACIFKLNNDGSAAQLVGAVSPELNVTE